MNNIFSISQAQANKDEGRSEQPWPLTGLSLGSFLQVIAMDQKTCILEVFRKSGLWGCFYFMQGELYNAESGSLQGEDAAFEMIPWEDVKLRIRRPPQTEMIKIINKSLIMLLMESSRLRDEMENSHTGADQSDHNTSGAGSDLEPKIEILDLPLEPEPPLLACIETLRNDMGGALVATAISATPRGHVLAEYGHSELPADIYDSIGGFIDGGIERDGSAPGRFYLLQLKDHRTMIILIFNQYRWGILFNNRRIAMGLFLSVIVPKIMKEAESVFAKREICPLPDHADGGH